MRRPTTRRTLLATLGAASTFSLAGCSGMIPTGPSGDSETTSTPTGTPDGSGTEGDGSGSSSGPGGSVIDDFEGNVKDRWEVDAGKFTTDTENAFQGGQSLVLQAKGKQGEGNATISRSFYSDSNDSSALDLSSHDLSLAVRFEKPKSGHIAISCHAPTESSSLTCRRFIPQELNGWTRFDLGYTGKQGQPDPSKVFTVQISVMTDNGEPIKVGIDDLRKVPKASKGKVMFQFDDSVKSAYDTVFPMFNERDWQAGVAIIPDVIGSQGRLSTGNMREMADAGWDMMSHTSTDKLPTQSKQDQKKAIEQSKQQLKSIGFKTGSRHFVAPNGRVNRATLDIIRNNHKTNFMFGAGPGNAKQPTNMYTIPRVMGASPDAVVDLLDLAEQFNQLVVVQYHGIGGDDKETTTAEFEQVVKHVEKKDMDVVSPSQFLDSIGN
ncbi:polysaccharide deacetylase family protein [Halocatena salina]|uniref:Polysaccharide deacetylase family protein n=1 Tax=Halocatena salina TaxID=2934340 RepID=A0A8U0A4M3_9EURY|nr:polysaccharide deacetylase family protein [Halocatena salina]UPM43418.1 polysaccharide deacetylase family protein [Halocatena salina]